MIGIAEMVEAFEVGLPISDILVIEPVNHMFAQDQVRQERVGTAAEEAGRNEICLMDFSACVTAADCVKHLIAQPAEVCLQLGQHVGRGEVPRQRLVTVQHVARIDRKSTRLNSSHVRISYAVFCLKKKKKDLHSGRRL